MNTATNNRPYRNLSSHELECVRVAAHGACFAAACQGREIDDATHDRWLNAELEKRARVAEWYAARGNRGPRC